MPSLTSTRYLQLALVSLLFPLYFTITWIYVGFTTVDNQSVRVARFREEFLPSFLSEPIFATLAGMMFCFITIWCTFQALYTRDSVLQKYLALFLLAISTLLFLWFGFSLLS